jgi:putative two-component system response regulator
MMISSENSPIYVDRAYDLGVLDYINRPFDERTVRHRVRSTITMATKQNDLSNMVIRQIYEKEKDNRLMVEILSNIVEFRNGESGMHVLHIHALTEMILKKLLEKTDKYGIALSDIPLICTASSLHDIGKIAIPEEILNKPGRLTEAEFEVIKTHSAEGARLLRQIPQREKEPLIQIGYQICRWHHERYDGRGYPDGLKGDEIPMVAQVVALADVYDALTSKRVYKAAFSHEKAIEMILGGECGAFNPILLECLVDISDELKKELNVLSLSKYSEREILNTVEAMMERDEIDVSDRTLRLLEYERVKNSFYANLDQEIRFEYTKMPELLNLSNWGARYLDLPQTIVNPKENPAFNQVFVSEDFEKLMEQLHQTATHDAQIKTSLNVNIKGTAKVCQVVARAMWMSDDAPDYESIIGKITVLE